MGIVWVLTGQRAGDNAQAIGIASEIGAEVIQKPLVWSAARVLPNLFLRASLAGIDRRKSAPLEPPWPNLVVGVGRRSVPVALWIKKQSAGRAKIVQIGRPRAPLRWFDLVVTSPQYALPHLSNVIEAPLPYSRSSLPPADLDEWRTRWQDLPRPLTALLIGGSKFPYILDARAMRSVAQNALTSTPSGTLIAVTSPRTGRAANTVLKTAIAPPHEVYVWRPSAPNPYRSLLHLADSFIVTEDSISMIAEAAATTRPLTIASVGRLPSLSWRAEKGLRRWLAAEGILVPPRNVPQLVHRLSTLNVEATTNVWRDILRRIRALLAEAESQMGS